MELTVNPFIEDGKSFCFSTGGGSEILQWREVISDISLRWGEAQKTDQEHELAAMRKQLGQLWELATSGTISQNVQKVNIY
jgi:hypothetical protein